MDLELECIDAACQMAGSDTTQALHPPNLYCKDDDGGDVPPDADD
ncbi:hypothetical protein [Caballeronia sp. J97]|nr:hypothetical protein [Caballeronia sp. J97]